MGRTFVDFQFVYSGLVAGSGMAALAALIFLSGISLGGLVAYCPSPCRTAWPLMEIANWANVVTGAIAALAVGAHLWERPRPA